MTLQLLTGGDDNMSKNREAIDLTGMRFGAWRVIERCSEPGAGPVRWLCQCDCGTLKPVLSIALRSGKSTGCHACVWNRKPHPRAHTDGSRRQINKKRTHIYNSWQAMKDRCNRADHKSYKNYGGRGIKVCDEWNKSFQAYFDYVSRLEHYGEVGYSLDRIDNDGNYEPGNVRYATRAEQERNKRAKRLHNNIPESFGAMLKHAIKIDGMTQSEFAKEIGVSVLAVNLWLNGKRIPSSENLQKVLKKYPDILAKH